MAALVAELGADAQGGFHGHENLGLGVANSIEAVRAGAVGATTLVVDQGRIVFPGDEEFPDQSLVAPLKNYFRMDDGDVIIIGSAFSYDAAEKGAVTAALALSNLSRRCWNEGTELLSRDTEADELRCLALAVHELLGRLPVTMRSRNRPGVRCEEGEVIDTHYTGPMLEEAMKRGAIVRRVSTSGPYRGLPVIAVPIMRKREAIAAIANAAVMVEIAPIKDDAMPARAPCIASPPTVALPNTKPRLDTTKNNGASMLHTPPSDVNAKKNTSTAKNTAA